MNENEILEQFIPPAPRDEVFREGIIMQITSRYGRENTRQIITGTSQLGKTTLLSQFVRANIGNTIHYFITSSPLSQTQHAFLYTLCYQLSAILDITPPAENIALAQLQSLFLSLTVRLSTEARKKKKVYYYVIDGLEYAFNGNEGERIIDLLPLDTRSHGPYVLYSCRSDIIRRVSFFDQCMPLELPFFGRIENKAYLQSLELSEVDVERIFQQCSGIPGYISTVKQSLIADPSQKLDIAQNFERQVARQIELVLNNSDPQIRLAIELLAASPAPLMASTLSDMVLLDQRTLTDSVTQTGMFTRIGQSTRLECLNDTILEQLRAKLGDRTAVLQRTIIEHFQKSTKADELVLDALYKVLQDYEGFKTQLGSKAVVSTLRSTGDISLVLKRLRDASDMAKSRGSLNDLVKWSLMTSIAKGVVDQLIDPAEVRALLAIGEDQVALRKIYGIGEITMKIRLLAQAYTFVREQGRKIDTQIHEELTSLVRELSITRFDRDILREIASDLTPVLPDLAMYLYEQISRQSKNEGVIETVGHYLDSTNGTAEREQGSDDQKRLLRNSLFVAPKWLVGKEIYTVIDELQPSSVKSKEFIIRQWCLENRQSSNLHNGIELWIDTVESDRDFVFSLQSLQQMTEVLLDLPISLRKSYIERLRIPRYTSITEPKAEWMQVRLNLAYAIFGIDSAQTLDEVRDIHDNILHHLVEADEKAFCLAKLRKVLTNIAAPKEMIQDVCNQFQVEFDRLLSGTANQIEVLAPTIATLTQIDPSEALVAATELNTAGRRAMGYEIIINNTLETFATVDCSRIIRDALSVLSQIDEGKHDHCLMENVTVLRSRKKVIHEATMASLIERTRSVRMPNVRARIFASLAYLEHIRGGGAVDKLFKAVIDAWSSEKDLLERINLGYQLVEIIALYDVDKATLLMAQVQELNAQPGAELGVGRLAAVYTEILRMTIRILASEDYLEESQTIRSIEQLIDRLPAMNVRLELYSRMAASAYRNGSRERGNRIVRLHILRNIRLQDEGIERDINVATCLSVIYEFDQSEAESFAGILPNYLRHRAWYDVIFWLLAGRLRLDFTVVETKHARFAVERPRLQSAIRLIPNSGYDVYIRSAINMIAQSVEESQKNNILDVRQAFGLLTELENLVTNTSMLPDSENISHDGYVIWCLSDIVSSKTAIWQRAKKKVTLSKKDIENFWTALAQRARLIPNHADKMFTMAMVASSWAGVMPKDDFHARNLLNEAYELRRDIPTIEDRLGRIGLIAECWRDLGERDQAKFVLNLMVEAMSELTLSDDVRRLEMITKLAYKINPIFADEVIAKLAKSNPLAATPIPEIAINIEQLIEDPRRIMNFNHVAPVFESAIRQSALHLKNNYISSRGVAPTEGVLTEWMLRSQYFSYATILDVMEYIIESLYQKRSSQGVKDIVAVLTEVARFALFLASNWDPTAVKQGVPIELQDSFPSLSSKYVIFDQQEDDRAHKWLAGWLTDNTRRYLKICDPYFGVEQIEYLKYIPSDCRVIIVTTDKQLDLSEGSANLRKQIQRYWQKETSLMMPKAVILIVPQRLEGKFHDRVVITEGSGLDMGQSLNGLGKAKGKISLLSPEEAQELERTYVEGLLSQATWFMEYGLTPTVITFE